MSRIKPVFLSVFASVLMMTLIVSAEVQAQAGTGGFGGTIFKDDLKTPVPNAVVKIKKTETGEEYQSKPADAEGAFSLNGVKEGWYNVGITTAEGNFNFEYKEVFIKQGETTNLVIALNRNVSKGYYAAPVGIAAVVISPGEKALIACRQAMIACEHAFSASASVEARLAYQRAMLMCEQTYLDIFAAYQPKRVNEEAFKKSLALCKEARLALDQLGMSLAAGKVTTMNKGLEDDKPTKADEKKNDSTLKKIEDKVKEVAREIGKKVTTQNTTTVIMSVRG